MRLHGNRRRSKTEEELRWDMSNIVMELACIQNKSTDSEWQKQEQVVLHGVTEHGLSYKQNELTRTNMKNELEVKISLLIISPS
jgi:hypothetical protein